MSDKTPLPVALETEDATRRRFKTLRASAVILSAAKNLAGHRSSFGRQASLRMTVGPVLKWLLTIEPGGIRTHDLRIKSP
ncbi:MAG: hypothetical protein L0228_07310, partial [Planctomycetes bacterium]|nr:hypothetical protein [Planctomycetota bacterium]